LDSSFPPTHLSHGARDPSVLPTESVRTYDQLKVLGVDTELAFVEGFGHMYEFGKESDPVVRKVLNGIVAFLVKHLEA
jgi:predicted esterase